MYVLCVLYIYIYIRLELGFLASFPDALISIAIVNDLYILLQNIDMFSAGVIISSGISPWVDSLNIILGC